jgi:hypothetical protein
MRGAPGSWQLRLAPERRLRVRLRVLFLAKGRAQAFAVRRPLVGSKRDSTRGRGAGVAYPRQS